MIVPTLGMDMDGRWPSSGVWWASEKLDGMRALWDGLALYSRLGNRIHAPADWLTRWCVCSDLGLDGELWAPGLTLHQILSITRRARPDHRWGAIQYRVFDAPLHRGGFSERLKVLAGHPGLVAQERVVMPGDRPVVESLYRGVVARGGEGVILRDDGIYRAGRGRWVLKIKATDSEEGVVVGTNDGEGRLTGMIGSLSVRFASGGTITVGTGLSDDDRRRTDWIGQNVVVGFRQVGGARVEPRLLGAMP
jgi:DNA ligase-1